MRSIAFFVVLGLGLNGLEGCGSNGNDLTPQTACNEEVSALCNWGNHCGGVAALTALGGYTSVQDCITKMQASQCTGTNAQCDTGKTFHTDKAQQCIDGTNSMACPSSSSSTTPSTPAACDQVCQ